MDGTNNGRGNHSKKPLDWPTLVLILVTGGGNFLANQQGRSQLSYEQQEAIARIREVHGAMEGFENRQKLELEQLKAALENQQRILANQQQMLNELKKP